MKVTMYVSVLFLMTIILATTFSPGRAQELPAMKSTYVSATQCKLCHNKPGEGQQFAAWQKAPHSGAYATLLGEQALAVAKEKGLTVPPSESADCLKCHVTGYNVETKSHPEKLRLEDGVQCDSCHGPGSAHMADGKKLRMNKDAGIDVLANLMPADVNSCATCHNEESPTWDPSRYVLDSGATSGFHFDQAVKKISHKNPKKVSLKNVN